MMESNQRVLPKIDELSTVDKLRMLLDITKTISRSLDLDEVLKLVMDTLGSLIPYDAAGIYLIERREKATVRTFSLQKRYADTTSASRSSSRV